MSKKSSASANCFIYYRFFEKVLLNRNKSICKALFVEPARQDEAGLWLQKNFKEIADRAVTCFQIVIVKSSTLHRAKSIGDII